jgi:hypothetical protein
MHPPMISHTVIRCSTRNQPLTFSNARASRYNTFMIRVAESRFGYSLSLLSNNGGGNGRFAHYMIDQGSDGRYLVVGNRRTFPSLNELVAFHTKYRLRDDAYDQCIYPCPMPADGSGSDGFHDMPDPQLEPLQAPSPPPRLQRPPTPQAWATRGFIVGTVPEPHERAVAEDSFLATLSRSKTSQ